MKRKLLRITLTGTGMNQTFLALSHEVVGLPASTYHKFVLENGAIAWKNDFGVSDVIIDEVILPEEKKR